MPRQPDHTDVVGEILATELRPDPDVLGDLEDLLFEPDVAKCAPVLVPGPGQVVQIVGARQLDRLERELGRRPADDQR